MLVLKVPDMSCGGCAATIKKAVHAVDPAATVEADLAAKQVSIGSAADPAVVSAAIQQAGYRNTGL